MSNSKALIIIPTYNEIENINSIVHAVLAENDIFHILVVDDNSPDGTAEKVVQLQSEYPERIHLLKRSGKLGLGTAYITGFKYALEKTYAFIFEMDADFSHNPKDLNRLLTVIEEGKGEVAVGSRYISNGGTKNWGLYRLFLSRGASLYVQLITWMGVKDPTAGFVCYKREVLEKMDLRKIHFIGYAFQIEMKFYAKQLGFRIVEVPITFADRVKGKSKMNSSIVTEAIKGVLAMKWKGLKGYYRD